MCSLDSSETQKKYKYKIEGLNACKDGMAKLWEVYRNPERDISYELMSCSLVGFNSRFKSYSLREPYHTKFFEVCEHLVKNDVNQVVK